MLNMQLQLQHYFTKDVFIYDNIWSVQYKCMLDYRSWLL
jgi:hypothetical protein